MSDSLKKKLIEVALPLKAINEASSKEKSLRHGHPSTLHLWWARRPLAACRAVLFASLVDDPSAHPERFPNEASQEQERERLLELIRQLVIWENTTNEQVLAQAREEIRRATNGAPPPVLDPFAGGGSIPLEALRLGLEAHAGDLNPVAVLINKALIEIPPRFAGRPPVHPQARQALLAGQWEGARGLAADIRAYGRWLRDEAERRIGHLYPRVPLPTPALEERPAANRKRKPSQTTKASHSNGEATVIAWLWARTVTCPNPACGAQMPLVRTFWLSKKRGHEAWVEPLVERESRPPRVRFVVHTGDTGQGEPPAGTVNLRGARCVVCDTPVGFSHIRTEGRAGRMGAQLMAIVADGPGGRLYLAPNVEQEATAAQAAPLNPPQTFLPDKALGFRVQQYGMTRHSDLFTPRQLVALTTFSDLIAEARERVLAEARAAWGELDPAISGDERPLREGGSGPVAYADALATYLALAVDRCADYWSTLCSWVIDSDGETIGHTFNLQTLSMVWDFAEANPFSTGSGNFMGAIDWVSKVIKAIPCIASGVARQCEASAAVDGLAQLLISTDPPYYDNVGYADLSDFFYVWLRRSLAPIYPDLFATLLTPKGSELIASPYRHGGDKDQARRFFEEGLRRVFANLRAAQHPDYPLTLYYAFKQAEVEQAGDEAPDEELEEAAEPLAGDEAEAAKEGQAPQSAARRRNGKQAANGQNGTALVASTGWETMLEGLISAGFTITGTWPIRTERSNRTRAIASNALASSIVLVCRPRPEKAPIASRQQFLRELRQELPQAIHHLQQGGIAPVDLAQASIGPGMAIYSRYRRVEDVDGSPVSVHAALQLINRVLDEILTAQEGDFDNETRWAVAWFEQFGFVSGDFGSAETLSKAKNISIQLLSESGIVHSHGGKVRLLRGEDLPQRERLNDGQPLTTWEFTLRLAHALLKGGGEEHAARLLSQRQDLAASALELAYRLYSICERRGWAQEALPYNSLAIAWPDINQKALRYSRGEFAEQGSLLPE
ncbi:hypothetical protein KTAU_30280 [Thermogemmatispora aurantia]|uniref:DUF1156 domain-containing protein n=1 Tax=Thermogemmatispora aurantia TaxID=2045279 RepID=UPI0012839F0F|nr:DUF1156 domain-containing protein [Thermogemmatispora aurantia]GER84392.1 hypothetical protein KTAU_30280 [Thermogemmatispora aurantia]